MKLTDKNYHADFEELSEPESGFDRTFALLLAVAFGLIGLSPVLYTNGAPYMWALIIAGVFFGLGIVVPVVLRPLNNFIMTALSPLLLGLLFFLVVTPLGWVRRRIKGASAESYWRPLPGSSERAPERR
ncbi:MAG: hypothetical protein AAF449_15995 [Myxococcota bacterium]